MNEPSQLLYFGDPMCSWCYGFAPVLLRLKEDLEGRLPIHCVLGGLRPGPHAEKMDEKLKRFLRHHWEEVHRTTGQEFGYKIFDRDDFVYDTEPSCRAVAIVRKLKPDAVIDFFAQVQTAFYRDSKDTTMLETYIPLAAEIGVSPEEFTALWNSEDMKAETWKDFEFAASAGVRGFPTLIYIGEGRGQIICRGYLPYEDVRERVETVLTARKPVLAPTQEACDIEKGTC